MTAATKTVRCLAALAVALALLPDARSLRARQVSDATSVQPVDPSITDPKAILADRIPWYTQDADQQDHIRLHWSVRHPLPARPRTAADPPQTSRTQLSAAYGDYRTLCPATFAVHGNDFEVLEDFATAEGQTGYVARVPFMQKIVIVFRGYDSDVALSWEPAPIDFGRPVGRCTATNGCTAGRGVLALYNSARIATDNWARAKQAVNATGLKFSVTGHGIGGAVAQLAALDLGIDGHVHYAHSQAAPRAVSRTAATLLSEIFQGEAGQHVVANHDYFPHIVPRTSGFVRVNSAVWVFGNRTEWMRVCHYYPENGACLGNGTSIADNYYYFTPMGQCGAADKGF
ncbi:hypothetical protein PtA15_14A402 [Puccinia triticina]|uniref:Fungal lipase-type domain-containing protein n=1 Tax=Puccinia triticina TaxID=208348 RepID=A0ABY7D323_9BASI|nr:uncharacterized protein PtA15_14A402 [Puccinia triticina]WAQ91518.1 hypothetical protein PtA15_14A402 [Puccinia triticina]